MYKGFILLNCDLGSEEHIAGQLRQMSGIVGAHLTFGAYDVIAEIDAQGQDEFEKSVAEIRSLPSVVSTMTLNVMDQ